MIKTILTTTLTVIIFSQGFTQNGITATNIQVHATFHNVGVQVNYTGDVNKNATASLEANINDAGFQSVHRLSRVGNNRFVGTVFSLASETNVVVRVVFSDPDGVTNGTQTANISTRSEQVPVSGGNKIHVSTTGNNATGNGSVSSPYKTIQHAVDLAVPGNTIAIHAGTYHESVEIAYKNGTTENTPITITNAGDGTVILNGTDESFNNPNVWTNEGGNVYSIPLNDTYYVGIDGNRLFRYNSLADLKNLIYKADGGFFPDVAANKVYLKLPENASPTGHQITVSTLGRAFDIFESAHIIIEGLTFRNFNAGEHSSAIQIADNSIRLWITNCIFENMETPIRLEGFVEDLVVMNNEFSDQGVNVLDWDFVKDNQWWLERGALFITNDGYSGRGIIFYKNYVHDMFDGVKIVGSEEDVTAYPTNSEVEGNTFFHLSDDGVEVDGFACNIRIMNNRFENLLAGVSVAPAIAGPTYIVRNLMIDLNNVASPDWETTAVKFNYDGERSGEVFVYHNTASTFEANQAAISITNDANWDDMYIENNIWQGTEYGFYHWLENTSSLTLTHNYDLLFSTGQYLALFDEIEYMTMAAYTTGTGNCGNCLAGNPSFVNISGGDYHLTASSLAIDKAVLIPGINQNFVGTKPDMGAFEYGAATGLAVNNFYASVTGNNDNDGSLANPWRNIQFGLGQLSSGDTLNLMTGIFNEKIQIPTVGITLRNKAGDSPIIDAAGLTGGQISIVEIYDVSNFTIDGIELQNNVMNDAQGIVVEENCQNITIQNCKIHDIHFSANVNAPVNSNTNAQGIIVYGTDGNNAITNLKILNNELYDCRLGFSEGIAVNGNVDGFEVSGNLVHDITNIGLDFIGFEGTSSNSANDQARNGLVKSNTTYNCLSAYATSGGIYIDGGKDIIVENNTSYHNGYGIEIGCENVGKTTENITVRNNVFYDNEVSALAFGGFDYPSGSGKVINSIFRNNTCYFNDFKRDGVGEMYLSYTENCTIENNIFYASTQGIALYQDIASVNLTMNYNNYYTTVGGGIEFSVNGSATTNGIIAFNTASGQEANSIEENPLFVSSSIISPNFHLQASSPAINAGNPSFTPAVGEVDLDLQNRVNNGIVDCGVDEYSTSLGDGICRISMVVSLSEIPETTGNFRSTSTIETDGNPLTIEASQTVNFLATTSVTLKPGFHAKANSNFSAKIEACSVALQSEKAENDSYQTNIIDNNTNTNIVVLKPIEFLIQPNPVYQETTFIFDLEKITRVSINIYDLNGRLADEVLQNRLMQEGHNEINYSAHALQDGMYYVIMNVDGQVMTKKMTKY